MTMAKAATTKKAKGGKKPECPSAVDRSQQVRDVLALMEDGKSESAACSDVGIARNTFRSAALREGVADQYARALAAMAQHQINAVEDTIQDMRNGVIDAQMARVEIDTRKWFASKFLPRQYGDKVAVDMTTRTEDISDEELDRKIAEKMARAGGK